jgi:hypothetical protein
VLLVGGVGLTVGAAELRRGCESAEVFQPPQQDCTDTFYWFLRVGGTVVVLLGCTMLAATGYQHLRDDAADPPG